MAKIRRLRVYAKFKQGTDNGCGVCKISPSIVLTGNWLKDAGFEVGDRIQVGIIKEQIHIMKL